MPQSSQVEQAAEVGIKSKKPRKRQRCEEEVIRLRDFGPERQSGRLRILKEYPSEPVIPVQRTLPKTVLSPATSRSMEKKKVERQSKLGRKKQREKDANVQELKESAARRRKALKEAKRKVQKSINKDKTTPPAEADGVCSDQPKSKALKTRSERKLKRKEARQAIGSPPDTAALDVDIGDEILAIQYLPRRLDHHHSSSGFGEDLVAVQPALHTSLESMFQDDLFLTKPHIVGDIVTRNQNLARPTRQHSGTKQDPRTESRRLEYSQILATKKDGIKSSTFARVMRLVADLPPIPVAETPRRRERAAHRPPVWADVRSNTAWLIKS